MISASGPRRWVAMAVAVAAAEAILPELGASGRPHSDAVALSSATWPRLLAVLVAIALLVLTPKLWRDGLRPGSLVIAGLIALAALNVVGGAHYREAIPDACLALLAATATALTVRRPRHAVAGPEARRHDLTLARSIVGSHGDDPISPFILRPDKTFHLAAGGVLAYRVIGRTAVVSGDPVGPATSIRPLLESFVNDSAARGLDIVLYGTSGRHLELYRQLGLRALRVGEEAVVDPAGFTLEGRRVRKLRQSVHRIERHGWKIHAYEGRHIGAALESEIDRIERRWRSGQRRILGFAMGMGQFEAGVDPDALYLLGRSPDGELRAAMRFVTHRGKLSLATMRRVGETPNGLNEALVCQALELARRRGIHEVSLNYAGLAHLIRSEPSGNRLERMAISASIMLVSRHFQMQRLVRFNEKFDPAWRPRYLVYQSPASLPRSVFRVLQAEGYIGPGGRSVEDDPGRR